MMPKFKLFELSLRLNGFPVHEARKVLSQLLEKPIGTRAYIQAAMKNEIVKFHFKNNALYKSILSQKGINNVEDISWDRLPIIKKSDFQLPIHQVLSDGFNYSKVFKNSTSGSSGIPFHFVKDNWCHAMTWANNIRLFKQHGIDFNHSLQARFYGIPKSGIKRKKELLKDKLSHRVRFSVFDMRDDVCADYFKQFANLPFEYINGYTSSLVLFARYLVSQGTLLKDVCPTLKACFATSEMLSVDDRQIIEKGFGVKCVNEYGAAELELIAFEDIDGDWVINEENLFVEIVDENGQVVEDGIGGRILVTSLYNKAMPFIRYQLGDMGAIRPGRKGFNRILQQLTGRTNDIALLPNGQKVPGLTFYYVTKSILDASGELKEMVVKQLASDHFLIEYVRHYALNKVEEEALARVVAEYVQPGLKLTFKKSDIIARTASGKLKQFENLCKPL